MKVKLYIPKIKYLKNDFNYIPVSIEIIDNGYYVSWMEVGGQCLYEISYSFNRDPIRHYSYFNKIND